MRICNEKRLSLIYMHIPKTAGLTLTSILRKNYLSSYVYSVTDTFFNDVKSLPNNKRDKFDLYTGHMCFGLHSLLTRPSKYITLIRNPIERVISLYYYIKRDPDNHLYKIANDITLHDMLSDKVTLQLDNGQTRLLAGTSGFNEPFGECSYSTLETAKQNLYSNFAVVGLTERFNEILILLQNEIKLKNIFYTKQNVNKNRPNLESVNSQTIALIQKYNQLDKELYEYAGELLEDQIKQTGFSFRLKLKAFNHLNNAFAYIKNSARRTFSFNPNL